MTPDERERLAELIAQELRRALSSGHSSATADRAAPWLAPPVRPEPPVRGTEVPAWAGAAQALGDVAPVRAPRRSAHRDDPAAATAAVRAAAAGAAPAQSSAARRSAKAGSAPVVRGTRRAIVGVDVPVGVSRRHVHLSEADAVALFGRASLDVERSIRQPGQFAARERVTLRGPRGALEGVRVVGPARGETQVELARSDAARIGLSPPVAASGSLDGSLGGVTVVGPVGQVTLARGVIVAARHLHLSPDDAQRWGVRDGELLDIRCGVGARAVTWHEVRVRTGPAHATEFHLDEDEAHAAAIENGAVARVVGRRDPRPVRRRLVTERDLLGMVRSGESIPAEAIFTPSARDRARSLGLTLP
jgi:putative phosphotransacetylase